MNASWMSDSSRAHVAGLFLPCEHLMVRRAYPGGGDKHYGSAARCAVRSVLSAATKHTPGSMVVGYSHSE